MRRVKTRKLTTEKQAKKEAERIERVEARSVDISAMTGPTRNYAVRKVVLSLLSAGATTDQIVEVCNEKYGIGQIAVKTLMNGIYSEWRRDLDEYSAFSRAATVNRLKRDLAKMRAASDVPWKDVRGHESLLAKIEGTIQPLRVDVVDRTQAVSDALTNVLGSMSRDDLEAFVTEGHAVAAE